MSAQVYGIDTNYFKAKNVEVIYGSNITESHINNLDKVAVIGQDIVTELFPQKNPV
jgi:hypothetical protein